VSFNLGLACGLAGCRGTVQATATVTATDGSVLADLDVAEALSGWGPTNTLTFTATTPTSTLTFENNSPPDVYLTLDNVSVEPLNRPAISLSGNLDFGSVAVEAYAFRTLMISNSGNATLTVSNINCPAGFNAGWQAGTIPAGGAQSVFITFQPTAVQNYSGTLSVSSDALAGSGQISVSGQGAKTGTAPKTMCVQNIIFTLAAWSEGNPRATGIANKDIISALSGATPAGSASLPTFRTGAKLLAEQNPGSPDTRVIVRQGSGKNASDYDVTSAFALPATISNPPPIFYVKNGLTNYHAITTFAFDIPNRMSFVLSGLTAASETLVGKTYYMSKRLSGTVAGSGVISGQTNLIGGTVSLSGGHLE